MNNFIALIKIISAAFININFRYQTLTDLTPR